MNKVSRAGAVGSFTFDSAERCNEQLSQGAFGLGLKRARSAALAYDRLCPRYERETAARWIRDNCFGATSGILG